MIDYRYLADRPARDHSPLTAWDYAAIVLFSVLMSLVW